MLNLLFLEKDGETYRAIRGAEIAMIFQEPMTAFSPLYSIGNQLAEIILIHEPKTTKQQARERVLEMLKKVGIANPEKRIDQYPHEFSGGMLQRALIAMMLCLNPTLLIADEPTTALDVTIQAQILELMLKLQKEFGMSILFITHDLGVVANICDHVAVMYLGEIVEYGTTQQIFHHPQHPYTKGLLSSLPKMDQSREEKLFVIAQAAGCSRKTLYNVFKTLTGFSPRDYLIYYRMWKATVLLKNPGPSIDMVATAVGYGDQFHFSKEFKKNVGLPPSEYRKVIRMDPSKEYQSPIDMVREQFPSPTGDSSAEI